MENCGKPWKTCEPKIQLPSCGSVEVSATSQVESAVFHLVEAARQDLPEVALLQKRSED
jgi:hypothetical protein